MFGSSLYSGIHAAAFHAADAIPEASPLLQSPGAGRDAASKDYQSETRKKFKEAEDLLGLPALPRATKLEGWLIAISN